MMMMLLLLRIMAKRMSYLVLAALILPLVDTHPHHSPRAASEELIATDSVELEAYIVAIIQPKLEHPFVIWAEGGSAEWTETEHAKGVPSFENPSGFTTILAH